MTDLRQQYLDEMSKDRDPNWRENFKPGTFGCHEALHMASVVGDMVDTQLLSHPAIIANPEWFAKAEAAAKACYDLYQAIGAEHMK